MKAALVPELDVTDLQASLLFYVDVLGFTVRYSRPDEQFAYLEREGAELMLQASEGPGRRFRTATLDYPFGRGINLQIRCSDVTTLYARVRAGSAETIVPIETRWYRADAIERGNRQFVVVDPDGYLLRFFEDLGERPA